MALKLLFAGSVPDEKDNVPGNPVRKGMEQACRALGKAVAARGMEIVIGSAEPDTPDHWFLEGAASVEGRKIRVWLVRPAAEGSSDVGDLAAKLDFVPRWVTGTWAAVSVAQIQRADVALVIGGRSHVRNLGYSAPTLSKAVVAIPWFGGAGEELWTVLRDTYARLSSGSEKLLAWSKTTAGTDQDAKEAVDALVRLHSQRVFRISRLHPLVGPILVLVATLVLFAAWVGVFAYPKRINEILHLPSEGPGHFFELLVIAALLGTTLRNSMRFVLDSAPEVDARRLLAEFVCGILLAFGLALLFLVGAITITGTPNTLVTEGEEGLQRIAVVMTLLGLAGGLLIEQTAESLRRRLMAQIGDGSGSKV